MIKKITSLTHPLIKHLVSLRKNPQYRKEKKTLLVAGEKILKELPLSSIKTLITSEKTISIKAPQTLFVTEAIMKKITNLITPEKVAAEIFFPKQKKLHHQQYLLILDHIQDPGNLGTLIRTAYGLSWDGVIITPDSVDPYNDKALRAAKGATLYLPLFFLTKKEILIIAKEKNYHLFVADIQGEKIENISFFPPLMLILSHESKGVDPSMLQLGKRITIPMHRKIDSLNVAISGGILMYLMKQ